MNKFFLLIAMMAMAVMSTGCATTGTSDTHRPINLEQLCSTDMRAGAVMGAFVGALIGAATGKGPGAVVGGLAGAVGGGVALDRACVSKAQVVLTSQPGTVMLYSADMCRALGGTTVSEQVGQATKCRKT